jgi:hypothetical protein
VKTQRRRLAPPRPSLRGRFLLIESALDSAERLLPTYRGSDGDHEGLAFLLGTEAPGLTVFTSVLAPEADHGHGHVICTAEQVAAAARAARQQRLALLGQVHSHPRDSTHHSAGDDDLVLMPFEGMLSFVAPWFCRHGLRPIHTLGVHQYQDASWVEVCAESVRAGIAVVPAAIDLR